MKTIKLKLKVEDQRNPVLVDDENNVIVGSSHMAWLVVGKEKRLIAASPSYIAEFNNTEVSIQVDNNGKPLMFNGKIIIIP
jgi:hypothetical protein